MSNYIILNDLSLRGQGQLRDNWDKFTQFDTAFMKLKSLGIQKIVVPNDINNLRICGFKIGDSYYNDNQELEKKYKQQLAAFTKYFKKLQTLDKLDDIQHGFETTDGCSYLLARCVQERLSCISFAFRKLYETDKIEGKYKEGKNISDESIKNIYAAENITDDFLPFIVSKTGALHRKPLEEPLWNVPEAKEYRKKVGFTSQLILDNPADKIRILTRIASAIAQINGWVKDENVSSLNSNSGQIREIFVSKYFSETNCYMSIDFEKPEVYFELHNSRGRHQGQIKWDGTDRGDADKTGHHDIVVSR